MRKHRSPKYWKKYFQNETVNDIQLFSDRNKRSIQLEYTKNLKKLQQNLSPIVRLEKLAYKVTTGQVEYNETLEENIEFEKQAVNSRLEDMSNKYAPIRYVLALYNNGELTLDELNDIIEDFKETNLTYLSNYGHK